MKFNVYRTSTGRLGGIDIEIRSLEELTSLITSVKCDAMIVRPLREGDPWELRVYDEYDESQYSATQPR